MNHVQIHSVQQLARIPQKVSFWGCTRVDNNLLTFFCAKYRPREGVAVNECLPWLIECSSSTLLKLLLLESLQEGL